MDVFQQQIQNARRAISDDPTWSRAHLESYIAWLSDSEARDGYIVAYLETVVPRFREEEREQLLTAIDLEERRHARSRALRGPLVAMTRSGIPLDPPPILERRIDTTAQVPLFDFSAPPIEGCSVSIQTSTSQGGSGTWRVSLGAGRAGPARRLRCRSRQRSALAPARANACLCPFQPVQSISFRQCPAGQESLPTNRVQRRRS